MFHRQARCCISRKGSKHRVGSIPNCELPYLLCSAFVTIKYFFQGSFFKPPVCLLNQCLSTQQYQELFRSFTTTQRQKRLPTPPAIIITYCIIKSDFYKNLCKYIYNYASGLKFLQQTTKNRTKWVQRRLISILR